MIRRVGILLNKEFIHGSKSFIFIYAVIAPIVISLVIALVFGTLFSEKPKLGIVTEGESVIVSLAEVQDSVLSKEYDNTENLKQAVESGSVDMGIIIPIGFDEIVKQGGRTAITAFIWGESLLIDQTILGVTITNMIREIGGMEAPIEIVANTIGDASTIPWNDRILPFIVLMTIVLGGAMLPATSIVDEKQKRTLRALTMTPVSLNEVLLAKATMGVILSLFMGFLILVINQVLGSEPLLLVFSMLMGAILAAEFGVLLSLLISDLTTLFATIKFTGILLYTPAFIYLFPQIPEWIGRLFPTYYIIKPIVEISQRGGGWDDVAFDLVILGIIIILMLGLLTVITRRVQQREF